MSEDWTAVEYERQKRRFIESRTLTRSIYLHASFIFAGTLLAGWAASWVLLKLGLVDMPTRYAIVFAVSYGCFLLIIRIWADSLRTQEGNAGAVSDVGFDIASADAEGCLFVIAAWTVGLVLAGVFALLGGVPMLLEVAFEVVFAGVIVRRARRAHVLGDWLGTLVRRTWVHAVVSACLLVAFAAYLQHRVPGARTIAQALHLWK